MTPEEQAELLARWLDHPTGEPPQGIDDDALEAVYALRPDLAPAPRVSVEDILRGVATGPLAQRTQAGENVASVEPEQGQEPAQGQVVAFPSVAPRRRVWWAIGGGTGATVALAATVLLAARVMLETGVQLAPETPGVERSSSAPVVAAEATDPAAAGGQAQAIAHKDTGSAVPPKVKAPRRSPAGSPSPAPQPSPPPASAPMGGSAPLAADEREKLDALGYGEGAGRGVAELFDADDGPEADGLRAGELGGADAAAARSPTSVIAEAEEAREGWWARDRSALSTNTGAPEATSEAAAGATAATAPTIATAAPVELPPAAEPMAREDASEEVMARSPAKGRWGVGKASPTIDEAPKLAVPAEPPPAAQTRLAVGRSDAIPRDLTGNWAGSPAGATALQASELIRQGRGSEAEAMARKGLALEGNNTPLRSHLLVLLGDALELRGDVGGAERAWAQARELNRARMGPTQFDLERMPEAAPPPR